MRTAALLLLCAAMLPTLLGAQCATQWLSGGAFPGVNNLVTASTTWDPDGAGPQPPILVLGGGFSIAGPTLASGVATYDQATGVWSALGDLTGGIVSAFAILQGGDLVAGGSFAFAEGLPCNGIARWDGSGWSSLGGGVTNGTYGGYVKALAVLPSGDLVAAGNFMMAGTVAASNIARWDGTAWHPLGGGVTGTQYNMAVASLVVVPSGDLIAAGSFTQAGAITANGIARWDGATWHPLGGGMQWNGNGGVFALAVLPGGDLVAGGDFYSAGGLTRLHVARWDGASWSPPMAGVGGPVEALTVLASGDLAAGHQRGAYSSSPRVLNWNGSVWTQLGANMDNDIFTLTVAPSGDLIAGGFFRAIGSNGIRFVARWDGTEWATLSAPGDGLDFLVDALVTMPDGDVVAAGAFTIAGGVPARHIARWDGSNWHALGNGIPWPTYGGGVFALAVLPNGDLVAGGSFGIAGTAFANNIARWDGSTWHAMGAGLTGGVWAMLVLQNGDLVAGGGATNGGAIGTSNLSRWDGAAWTSLGLGYTNGVVYAVAELQNGDLVAGGSFSVASNALARHIVQFDGSSWSELGGGMNSRVQALAMQPIGELVAGGSFTWPANRMASWNGSSWSALGSGIADGGILAIANLPNGDLVAGGFHADHLSRWNGTTWSPLGTGLNGNVHALTGLPSGDLVAAGSFTMVGGQVSAYTAQLATTCPASTATIPTACLGPAGPLTLTADSLPWTGATFRSTATGFANSAIAVSLLGLSPQSTPLSQLFPNALPNCDLLVSTEAILLQFPTAGTTNYELALPNDPVFAGLALYHQFLQVELGPQGGLASASSSNALTLTVGAF